MMSRYRGICKQLTSIETDIIPKRTKTKSTIQLQFQNEPINISQPSIQDESLESESHSRSMSRSRMDTSPSKFSNN